MPDTTEQPMQRTPFSSILWEAEFLSNHDGDTIRVLAIGPWFGRQEIVLRIMGIQCAEVGGSAAQEERAQGYEVRDFVTGLLAGRTRILMRTVKPDAYHGRYDGDIYIPTYVGKRVKHYTSLAEMILSRFEKTGHVCRYDGKGKAPSWPFVKPV